MTTTSAPLSRRLVSAAWKIALAVLPLGAGLGIVSALLPAPRDPSDPMKLAIRIAVGVMVSALTLAVIAMLVRRIDRERMSDAGLTNIEGSLTNLYQTKGREAHATVVVLREGDFMGYASEPFPTRSRLLYVVFSRARHKIVALLVGNRFHAAVAPLAALAANRACPRGGPEGDQNHAIHASRDVFCMI